MSISSIPAIPPPLPDDYCELTIIIKLKNKDIELREDEALLVLKKLKRIFTK